MSWFLWFPLSEFIVTTKYTFMLSTCDLAAVPIITRSKLHTIEKFDSYFLSKERKVQIVFFLPNNL